MEDPNLHPGAISPIHQILHRDLDKNFEENYRTFMVVLVGSFTISSAVGIAKSLQSDNWAYLPGCLGLWLTIFLLVIPTKILWSSFTFNKAKNKAAIRNYYDSLTPEKAKHLLG